MTLAQTHETSRDAPRADSANETGPRIRRLRSRAEAVWVLRPIARAAGNFLVFVALAFVLVKLIPGDPIAAMGSGRLSPDDLASLRRVYGLDDPIGDQFARYIWGLLTLDLGTAISTGRPIAGELVVRIPQTLELVFTGLFLASTTALALSYFLITHRKNAASRAITAYARSAGAVPEYILGIGAIYLFYAVLKWAPAPIGRMDPVLEDPQRVTGFPILDALLTGNSAASWSYAAHLCLPVVVMVVAHTPILVKTLLVGLLDAVSDPATKFRVASGAPRRIVVLSIYRRAMPSAVAMLGMLFGLLLGGAVVLEALFSLGGLGQYAVDAVNASDYFALRAFLVVTAAMSLGSYLVADLFIGLLDPRRRSSSPQRGK